MNLPMYSISIPRFTFKNWKLKKIRGTPKLLITPLFISFIKWGKLERTEDGGIVQNLALKSYTIIDFVKLVPVILCLVLLYVVIA